jgi:hypothetical protein
MDRVAQGVVLSTPGIGGLDAPDADTTVGRSEAHTAKDSLSVARRLVHGVCGSSMGEAPGVVRKRENTEPDRLAGEVRQ